MSEVEQSSEKGSKLRSCEGMGAIFEFGQIINI